MLLESSIACLGGFLTLMYLNGKDKRKIRRDWRETLLNCKSESIKIKKIINGKTVYNTYMLNKMYPTKYGWLAMANVPTGLTASALESAKEALEDKFGCKIEMEKEVDDKHRTFTKVKFIFNDIWSKPFEPCKTTSDELFWGYKVDGTPYKTNFYEDPHILIAGKTNSGKSFALAVMLANLFYNNPNDFEIYLIQVMKGEIGIFQDCKPTVVFTSTRENEINAALSKIRAKINERSQLFNANGVKNIKQWNKHFPKRKMKRILVIAEEMSFFMQEETVKNSDGSSSKQTKSSEVFTAFVKAGRSAGIHFIGLTQRTTVKNLDSETKAQMTVITAKQRSALDSNNAIGIPDAIKLKSREFIANANDKDVWFKVPKVDEDFVILNQYVPTIRIPKISSSNNEPITTLQNIKYSPVASKTITPEEYFLKTGYVSNSLQDKLSINETTIKPIKNSIEQTKEPVKQTEIVENESVMITSSKDKKKNRTKKKDKTANNEVNSDVKAK